MQNSNKYALILGASSGFGRSTAIELAKLGYNIYGVHLDLGSMKQKAEEFRVELEQMGVRAVFFNIIAADDNKRSEVIDFILNEQKTIEGHTLRILVHSLAFGTLKKIVSPDRSESLSRKQIEMTMDVMANSLVYWTQDLVVNKLLAFNSRIFAFTSIGSQLAMHNYGAVSAAKAALESYIRQIAVELAPLGITSNSIHAGLADTPAASKIPSFDAMIKIGKAQNPFKRVTTPEDVAKVVALASNEDFNWVNGTVIRVDGGEAIYKYVDFDDV